MRLRTRPTSPVEPTHTVPVPGGDPVTCREVSYLGHPFLYPETSDVGAAIERGWDWDHILRPIIDVLLPSEQPTICEVGSNIGASVLEILAVRPSARVSCYEPSDRYRAVLERNLAAAGHDDVTVKAAIVDSAAGTGRIHTDETSGRIHPMSHLTRTQSAPAVRLDDEYADRDEPLQFLKTDTDGNDLEVLRGAERLLREDKPVLFLEFCPSLMRTDPIADLRWLQSLGYTRLVCLDHLGFHVGTTMDPATALAWSVEWTYCDILAAADGTEAASRIADLPLDRRPAPVEQPPPPPPPVPSIPVRALRKLIRTARGRQASPVATEVAAEPTPLTTREAAELYQARCLAMVELSRHNSGGVIPTFPNLTSQAPSAAQCDTPEYLEIATRLFGWTEPPAEDVYHRKHWEWIYILQAIREAGLLRSGASAVGFGVGSEPVPAFLAAEGISVLATDQGSEGATGDEWLVGDQLMRGLGSLSRPHLIDDEQLASLVRIRDVDMNAVPADIGTFDIAWSSCVIEHLGSPQHGLDFVLESCRLLNPGGIAVHTTELELTEKSQTMDYGHCAVYRIEDLEELATRLDAEGCDLLPLNFTVAMDTFKDRWISVAVHPEYGPVLPDPSVHLKLVLGESVSTSFGLIIRKR